MGSHLQCHLTQDPMISEGGGAFCLSTHTDGHLFMSSFMYPVNLTQPSSTS